MSEPINSLKFSQKRVRVVCFGTFDILHLGHVMFLREAKKLGGDNAWLCVVVARDTSVEAIKGKKPIFSEEHRRALIESIKSVDKAILGTKGKDKLKVLKKIHPDVVVLGYDQWPSSVWLKEELEKRELTPKIIRLEKYGSEDLNSSTKIVRKILKLRKDWAKDVSP